MIRLALIMYSLVSTTLAGSFVVAALATGNDTLQPILLAVAAGVILALPIAWFVTKAILENE